MSDSEMKIERLDIESLQYSDVIYNYYLRNYNFMYCQSENYKKAIPRNTFG